MLEKDYIFFIFIFYYLGGLSSRESFSSLGFMLGEVLVSSVREAKMLMGGGGSFDYVFSYFFYSPLLFLEKGLEY